MDGLLHFWGVYRFRCESCDRRFYRNISRWEYLVFAKCPGCHRMDLNRWTREYYNPRTWTKILLALGAKPLRCEYCRKNFCSFLSVKEKFSKERRAARSHVVIPVGEGDPASGQKTDPVVK